MFFLSVCGTRSPHRGSTAANGRHRFHAVGFLAPTKCGCFVFYTAKTPRFVWRCKSALQDVHNLIGCHTVFIRNFEIAHRNIIPESGTCIRPFLIGVEHILIGAFQRTYVTIAFFLKIWSNVCRHTPCNHPPLETFRQVSITGRGALVILVCFFKSRKTPLDSVH